MWMHVLTIGMIAILFVTVYFFLIMPRMFGMPVTDLFLKQYYAHRGLFNNHKGVPENSMAAFRRAIDCGYGIEFDVQLTKDQIPVVFHDFSLKRICGIEKKISECTWEELKRLTLLESKETIPSLHQVLEQISGQVPIIIELKTVKTKSHLCQKVDDILQRYNGMYVIQSFNPAALYWYKKNRPNIIRGQLSTNFFKEEQKNILLIFLQHMLLNFLSKPDYIAYNWKYRNILSRYVCHKVYKKPAIAWTIRSEEELERCKKAFDLFIFEGFIPE